MKRSIKKIIIALTFFFAVGINEVKAADCIDAELFTSNANNAKEQTNIYGINAYGKTVLKMYQVYQNGNEGPYYFAQYTLKNKENLEFTAYCRNAGETSGISGDTKFCVEENVLQNASNEDEKKAYDVGVLQILENGYSKRNSQSLKVDDKTVSDDVGYLATNLAIRFYEMFWKNLNSNGDNGSSLQEIHREYFNSFLKDQDIKGKLETLADKGYTMNTSEYTDFKRINDDNIISGWKTKDGIDVTKEVEILTKQLIILGLDSAINYKGIASVSWSKTPTESSSASEKDTNGNIIYEKKLTYKVDIKNFTSSSRYVNVNFTCDDCNKKNISYEIYVKEDVNGKETKISSGTDLINYIDKTSGTGTIYLILKFRGSSCGDLKYDLNINYKDSTISTKAYSIKSENCQGKKCQEFYVLTATDQPSEGQLNKDNPTVQLCNTGSCEVVKKSCDSGNKASCEIFENTYGGNCCTYVEKLCKSGNSNACSEFNKEYNGKCSSCNTNMNAPVCTSTNTTMDIEEGYTSPYNDTCNISNEVDVLSCIADDSAKDAAGNSYKSNYILNNNYCSVYCKEDYHITLPGVKSANSGRYFSLSVSISGTKTCYTSKIDEDGSFNADLQKAQNEMLTAYTTWSSNKTSQNANVLNSKIEKFNDVIDDYNSCSGYSEYKNSEYYNSNPFKNGWKMDYNYNPKITFWYEESYMNNVLTDELETIGKKATITDDGLSICNGDLNDNTYNNCKSDWKNIPEYEFLKKEVIIKNGSNYEKVTKNILVSKAKYVKQTMTAKADYQTPTQFYTIYPSGSIAIASPGANIENAKELTNKLPVGLGTSQGVYNYTLVVKNLGEYYNSGELGRIWGNNDSVVSTLLKANAKCYANGDLKYAVNIDGKTSFNEGVYNCAYTVNCPNCPIECEPDGCENPNCPNNNCPIECDDCVYTNNNIDVNYRPITPDDINPNDRELGKNWKFDENNIQTALELKAYATTKEIEDLGETIYDIDFENPSVDAEFAMKVIMDSKMISKIREYNDRYESTYGYLNNSLKCYDYKNSADGETYKNIFCYSELIDELLTDSDTKNNIKITVTRPLSETERKNYNPSNGYFTTWTLANSSNWNIKTAYGFSINNTKKGYGTSVNIGPSWK